MDFVLALVGFVVAIGFCVMLFVLFRAFVLWYWRVEEILTTLQSIDKKLGILADDVPVRGKFQYSFLESIDRKLGRLPEMKDTQA